MAVQPKRIRVIRGGVRLIDYRGTGILPPNGGRIRPLIAIEHIPVVPNVPGLADFETLARVLRNQGLSLQGATDREGNVALFNPLNVLCYQARGANSISYGVEHMHLSTSEPWTKRQLRASAWFWQYAEREFGIPIGKARLGKVRQGELVKVLRRGHCSHRAQSIAAGYSDRQDPGSGYDWEYVEFAAKFYKRHHHFEGA